MDSTIDTAAAEETLGIIQQTLQGFSWHQGLVLLGLFAACIAAIRILMGIADRAMERMKLDMSIRSFFRSGLKVILWMVALCLLLGYLGVPMTSLVTILGVLGLAFSLAIQGTLSNLAGGIILLTARPFSAGDFVDAGGASGTVVEVGLFYTKLTTTDTKVVYIPNGEISGKTITNYSASENRRLEVRFTVSYDAPPETVKGCISRAVNANPMALQEPEPFIRLSAYQDSAVEYLLRVWCATPDYWTLYYDLLEQVKAEFDRSGVEIPYPHMDVRIQRK